MKAAPAELGRWADDVEYMQSRDPYFRLRQPPPTPDDEICNCSGRKPIKLMSTLSRNPLHCVNCNLEVAAESLSLSGSLVDGVAAWQSVYDALDRLWLDSGEYEVWAKQQLSDISSPLNRRGMALCEELNSIRRCYYWYFQDESIDGFEPASSCPNCHRVFEKYLNGVFPQFTCEHCKIITVGT